VRGLVTRFGTNVVHDGLDLDIRRGEVLGIVGGSGAGKSVLMRTILGLLRPAAGTVEIFGRDLWSMSDHQRRDVLRRSGVLFQDGALFSSLTVTENIEAPMRERGLRLRPALMDELAGVKLRLADLPPSAGPKYPAELSGGMRKRAGLARAIALDPELLFLDEPTAGLDPIAATSFDELIRGMNRALGLTVVMITHDLDSLAADTDRVAAIVDKKIIVGTLDELRTNPHPWLKSYFDGPRGRAAFGAEAASAGG
jgi:phospholipid/cholesterol/gamma-HCH transport system ATP-binding protein